MSKYFDLFQVIIILIAVFEVSFQQHDDISLESGEISGVNKIVDSASKEINEVINKKVCQANKIKNKVDFDSLSSNEEIVERKEKKIAKKKTLKHEIDNMRSTSKEEFKSSYRRTDINKIKQKEENDSLEVPKSSTNTQVNVTRLSCHDNKESSSEESQCKSTLVNYPFSASVQKKGAHFASGALIDKQHVLTVAEQFYNVRETIKLFRVRLGSVDCKRGGLVLPIKMVEIHPKFVQGQPDFDVALLRLSRPVETTEYIKPISLSTVQQEVVSAKFLTTYWPRLIVNGGLIPEEAKERLKHQSMRVSTQKLIPWKTCSTQMKARDAVLDENSLCLRPIAMHHSVCMPDVGAPVVADDGLWGITSGWTSEDCTKYPSPTIFTRINLNPVLTWLKTITKTTSD